MILGQNSASGRQNAPIFSAPVSPGPSPPACGASLSREKPDPRKRRIRFFRMVPLIGVEPIRYHYHGILSPARLPISPQRRSQNTYIIVSYLSRNCKLFSRRFGILSFFVQHIIQIGVVIRLLVVDLCALHADDAVAHGVHQLLVMGCEQQAALEVLQARVE